MIPKSPIILGILCVLVLIISVAGIIFFEESFSSFMNSIPYENKIKNDSKMLSEINRLGLLYQNTGDKEKFEKQQILMINKMRQVAVDSIGINSITTDLKSHRIPFEEASSVKQSSDSEPFLICNIPDKIPIHLQKIVHTEMFHLFKEKYSKHEIEMIIVDERFADSDIHYAFLAKTDDGNQTALTFFDVHSCTNQLTNNYDYFISCNDKKQNEHMSSIKKKHVIASLEHDEFCTIPLSPMYQSFYEYGKVFSDTLDEIEQKMMESENNNENSIISEQFLEMPKMELLLSLAWGIAYKTIDEHEIQKKIQEYNTRFGDLPDDLQELLDKRSTTE